MTEQNIKQNIHFSQNALLITQPLMNYGRQTSTEIGLHEGKISLGMGLGPDDKGDNVIFYSQEVFASFKSRV